MASDATKNWRRLTVDLMTWRVSGKFTRNLRVIETFRSEG